MECETDSVAPQLPREVQPGGCSTDRRRQAPTAWNPAPLLMSQGASWTRRDGRASHAHAQRYSASGSPGELLKPRAAGPTPIVSDSVGLGRSLRICISHELPGDTDTAGLGTTFQELLI